MKSKTRLYFIAWLSTFIFQVFCVIVCDKFPWLLVGWTLLSSFLLFTFEIFKPFAKENSWFDREDKYPIVDGMYNAWTWLIGFLLINIVYLVFIPHLVMCVLLPQFRRFLESKIGRRRAVNIDAILSGSLIFIFLIWFIYNL